MPGRTTLAALTSAFEALCQKALSYDPGSRAQLAALEGKCLAIVCRSPEMTLYLLPGETLRLVQFYEGSITTTLTGTSQDLLALATSEGHTLYQSGVSLEGSAQFLAELKKILQQLDIDWEMWLADQIGTLPAHFLAQQIRQVNSFARKRWQSGARMTGEYLGEESGIGLGRSEFDVFTGDIHQTRLAVDRLEARIDRLQTRTNGQ